MSGSANQILSCRAFHGRDEAVGYENKMPSTIVSQSAINNIDSCRQDQVRTVKNFSQKSIVFQKRVAQMQQN